MVDIHCHLLPGLDDGPDSLDEALEMAEAAIADGITHIVATPHASDTFKFIPELVRRRRDEIQARLGDRLTVATGCDFHLSFENLQAARERPSDFTINAKSYLLVEFADFGIPPGVEEVLYGLMLAGLRPIITHPERNALIRNNPGRLENWLRQGCYVQVTALSLLGGFGPTAQRSVETWLDRDCIHFFATDAHNLTSRPPRLRQAFDAVAKRHGQHVAQALFHENPLAALEGRSLPYAPEPAASGASEPGKRRRKRFLFF